MNIELVGDKLLGLGVSDKEYNILLSELVLLEGGLYNFYNDAKSEPILKLSDIFNINSDETVKVFSINDSSVDFFEGTFDDSSSVSSVKVTIVLPENLKEIKDVSKKYRFEDLYFETTIVNNEVVDLMSFELITESISVIVKKLFDLSRNN